MPRTALTGFSSVPVLSMFFHSAPVVICCMHVAYASRMSRNAASCASAGAHVGVGGDDGLSAAGGVGALAGC